MKIFKKIWYLVRLFRIEEGCIKTGSTKPKKQIEFILTKKHLYFAGVLLIVLMFTFYYGVIDNSWLVTETTYVQCTDGTTEIYEANKTTYCGESIEDYYARENKSYYLGDLNNGLQ